MVSIYFEKPWYTLVELSLKISSDANINLQNLLKASQYKIFFLPMNIGNDFSNLSKLVLKISQIIVILIGLKLNFVVIFHSLIFYYSTTNISKCFKIRR